MTDPTESGDAVRAIIAAGVAGVAPDAVTMAEDELALVRVIPAGSHIDVTDVEAIRRRYSATPAAQEGVYRVGTTDSFIDYFDQHRGNAGGGQVWADLPTQIVGVLDSADTDRPSFERHRVILSLQESPEWQVWTRVSGQYSDQEAFAEFLEGHRDRIIAPPAAELFEVIESLQATTNVEFKSSFRTQDGQRGLRYEESTTAKAGRQGQLEIPSHLLLRLRVYVGEAEIEVPARFRWRIADGGLRIGVVIDAVQEIRETADLVVLARLNTYLDTSRVLIGTPAGPR